MDDASAGPASELLGGTVTLFFTDVEGSTQLLADIGAERYAEVLDEHRHVVARAVADSGGREVDSRGEEVFAAFARARDAVAAAVAIEREHAAASWPAHAALQVRIGIHTGEPVVHGAGYLGLDVHRAARICEAAHGGQVLLSQTTCALVADAWPDGVGFKDLGEQELKGLPRPERLFQLTISGLPTEFSPLRLERVRPGSFAGEEETLADAVEAVAAARPRRARLGLRLGRAHARPSYGEMAWAVRKLIPEAPDGSRAQLAELAAELFDAARSTADADRLLADLDRKRLDRRLADYREMAVVSRRAQEQAEHLAEEIDLIEALTASRRRLDEVGEKTLRALHDGGIASPGSAQELLGELREGIAELDERLERARAEIDLTVLKLKRTHHHGIYRHGSVFVVPSSDELGIEHFREFATLHDARAYRRMLDAEPRQSKALGGGAPHDLGDAHQGYTPRIRDDRR